MQHEVPILVILFIIHSFLMKCFIIEHLTLFKDGLLPHDMLLQVIADQRCVMLNETVLFCASTSIKFSPFLTDKIVFKLIFIHKVFDKLSSTEVLNLEVWKEHGKVDNASC